MQEFSLKLKEQLTAGLRADNNAALGPQVISCRGLRTDGDMLRSVDSFDAISNLSQSFPYPQIIKSSSKQWVFTVSSGLASFKEWLSDGTLGPEIFESGFGLCSVASDNLSLSPVPTDGGKLQTCFDDNTFFASNSNFAMTNANLYDGNFVIMRTGDVLTPRSVCKFQGRMFFGGIRCTGAFLNSFHWLEILKAWKEYQPEGYYMHKDALVDGRCLLYSQVQGGAKDYPYALELCALTGFGSETLLPLVLQAIQSGSMGFLSLDDQIRRLVPLGNRIIAYCNSSIKMLIPSESPVMPYAVAPLLDFGSTIGHCIAGDYAEHLFVDANGDAWKIQNEYIPRRLGYSEFLKPLMTAGLYTFWDGLERDFYLTDGTTAYVLTRSGLTQINQTPSHVLRVDNKLYSSASAASSSFELVAGNIDFGIRGRKTIQVLQVGHQGLTNLEAAIEWRNDSTSSFKRSIFKRVASNGTVFPIVSGTEFRIVLRGNAPANSNLDWIDIRWKQSDNRAIRGLIS
jgi:hypothetical protein